MPQIFSRRANTIARVVLWAIPVVPLTAAVLGAAYEYTAYATNVGVTRRQPVPFSHKHHVGDDGLDCRYCHASVEKSADAGMPSTDVCMTCHSQLWSDAPVLKLVRDSLAEMKPLSWQRVHQLPAYVYFDHSIHIAKGIGCSTCHGDVEKMPLTRKVQPMTMSWCLGCHRAPEAYLRPQNQIYSMSWMPPPDQSQRGKKLLSEYHIQKAHLTDCSVCHR